MTDELDVAGGDSIAGDVHILRSFSPSFVLTLTNGTTRPDRRAFQQIVDPLTNEKAMSVYRCDVLDEVGQPYEAILEKHPDHLIVSHPAQVYADLGLTLSAAVEEGLVGSAHMHVKGLTGSRQSRLVESVMKGPGRWVKAPPGETT